jgi:Fe(3+) dicitrate transport protein
MTKSPYIFIVALITFSTNLFSQNGRIQGSIVDKSSQQAIPFATASILEIKAQYLVSENGVFTSEKIPYGKYMVVLKSIGYQVDSISIELKTPLQKIQIELTELPEELGTYHVKIEKEGIGAIGKMRPIEGVMIAKGKKAEIINMTKLNANLATNNSRQIYARIPGLNIWESDGAGIQLGIGGRGLSPSRTANYNTRQNGYDISADALGYPETYYTPPAQAIENIQFIKGASSLQFGPQFGGMINFQLKKGAKYRPLAGSFQKTYGSFNVNTTFMDVGGSSGRWRYYGYFNHKKGNEWRPNSGYELIGAGFNVQY